MTEERMTHRRYTYLVAFAAAFVRSVVCLAAYVLGVAGLLSGAILLIAWPLIVYVAVPGLLFAPPTGLSSLTTPLAVTVGWWGVCVLGCLADEKAREAVYVE